MAIVFPIAYKVDSSALKSAEDQIGGFTKGLAGVAAGIAAAFSVRAIVNFTGELIKAGEEETKGNARLTQVATSMNLFGKETDTVVARLRAYADTQQMNLGIDDDVIKQTQAKLLVFKDLAKTAGQAGGAFDRATMAALDLAATGFGTAESNAVKLGKAIQDPVKGMSALSRSGVVFTQTEKDRIKALTESNRLGDAQNLILQAVESRVGGTAAATATSSEKMQQAFNRLKESMGVALLPAFDKLVQAVTPLVEKLEGPLSKVAASLSPIFATLAGILPTVASLIAALAPTFAALLETVGKLVAAVLPVLVQIFKTLTPVITQLTPIVLQIIQALLPLIPAALEIVKAMMPLVEAILPPLVQLLKLVIPIITSLAKIIADVLVIAVDLLTGNFKGLAKVFTKLIDDFLTLGKNIVEGLLNGLKVAWESVTKWITDAANGISTIFKQILGIHSPSKVFEEHGKNIGEGLVIGMDSMQGAVAKSAQGLAGAVSMGFAPGTAGFAAQQAANAPANVGGVTMAALQRALTPVDIGKNALGEMMSSNSAAVNAMVAQSGAGSLQALIDKLTGQTSYSAGGTNYTMSNSGTMTGEFFRSQIPTGATFTSGTGLQDFIAQQQASLDLLNAQFGGGSAYAAQLASDIASAQQMLPMSANTPTASSAATINVTVNAGLGTNGATVATDIINTIKTYERTNGAVWAAA